MLNTDSTAFHPPSSLAQLLRTLFSILQAFLAGRFLLKLFGVNPAAGFTDFIYSVTHPFVNPFLNIFPATPTRQGVVEWATLLAILAYGIVFSLLIRLLVPRVPSEHQ
jgi:uncharacterized protein YggT (Ycf19 family)